MGIKPDIAAPAGRTSSVVLDPDHVLPDRDRNNNSMVPWGTEKVRSTASKTNLGD
jgi:hypothetical protein